MSVSISEIKTMLGVTSNSLEALSRSNKVKLVSKVKPGRIGYITSGFTSLICFEYLPPTSGPYKMSNFHGYDTNAMYPFNGTSKSGDISNTTGTGDVVLTAHVERMTPGSVSLYDMFPGGDWRICATYSDYVPHAPSTYWLGDYINNVEAQDLNVTVHIVGPGTRNFSFYAYKNNTFVFLPISYIDVVSTKTEPSRSISAIQAVFSNYILKVRVRFYGGDGVRFNVVASVTFGGQTNTCAGFIDDYTIGKAEGDVTEFQLSSPHLNEYSWTSLMNKASGSITIIATDPDNNTYRSSTSIGYA